jgi:hypothetical protein
VRAKVTLTPKEAEALAWALNNFQPPHRNPKVVFEECDPVDRRLLHRAYRKLLPSVPEVQKFG